MNVDQSPLGKGLVSFVLELIGDRRDVGRRRRFHLLRGDRRLLAGPGRLPREPATTATPSLPDELAGALGKLLTDHAEAVGEMEGMLQDLDGISPGAFRQ